MRGTQDSPFIARSGRIALAALIGLVVLATACSSSPADDVAAAKARVTSAQQAVDDAEAAIPQVRSEFCNQANDYILAIDRYGKLFVDSAATVGDVRTLGADLGQPRESTTAAAQAVLDAYDALNQANQELTDAQAALAAAEASASASPGKKSSSPPKPPVSASPNVPTASIDRVRQAEADLEAASQGITDQTPLADAAESFNSAAFALEISWLNLFADADCLTDEQSKEAVAAVQDYTVALQKDLKTAGFYKGEVDGIYGPQTVQAVEDLQQDADLPVTGLVDSATAAALNEAVAKKEGKAATEETIEASSVQTVLKLAGYWDGPIDGKWTPELTDALKEFQTALGVKPTGAVDAATLAALEEALGALTSPSPPPTTQPPSPEPSESPSSSG